MISRIALAIVLLLTAAAGVAQQPNLKELERKLLEAAKQREAAQKAQAERQERERREAAAQKAQAEKQERESAQKPQPLGRLVVTTDAECELRINGERKQGLAPARPVAIEVSVGEQLIECISAQEPRARVREVRKSEAGSQLVVMLNLAEQVASKRSEAASAAVPSVQVAEPQAS